MIGVNAQIAVCVRLIILCVVRGVHALKNKKKTHAHAIKVK